MTSQNNFLTPYDGVPVATVASPQPAIQCCVQIDAVTI